MRFEVIPTEKQVPLEGRNIGYLRTDNWDDWFEFNTLYVLTYFDDHGERHDLGGVKIGQFGMERKQRRQLFLSSSGTSMIDSSRWDKTRPTTKHFETLGQI